MVKPKLLIMKFISFILFFFISLALINAQEQDSKSKKNSSGNKIETQLQDEQIDRDNSDKDGFSSDNESKIFELAAQKLAINLKVKLNLTEDQTEDIESILIDYNKKIHDKENELKNNSEYSHNIDNSELVGNEEANPELIAAYEKIDVDVNKDIEKTLTENQLQNYINLKETWWAEVKSNVFSYQRSTDVNEKRDRDTTGLEEKFQKNAKNLSISLMKKIDLSLEQASDIKDILVDYQKEIYNTSNKSYSGERDNAYNGTNAIVDNENSNDNDNDRNQLTGQNNKLSDDYNEADKKANDDIENVLNKEQVQKYLNIKNKWWKEVKEKVYKEI